MRYVKPGLPEARGKKAKFFTAFLRSVGYWLGRGVGAVRNIFCFKAAEHRFEKTKPKPLDEKTKEALIIWARGKYKDPTLNWVE